jgi:hypothetical protein
MVTKVTISALTFAPACLGEIDARILAGWNWNTTMNV